MLLSEIIARNLVVEESTLKKDPELLKLIKARLRELKFFSGEIDGLYTPETTAAIANFCAARGLNNFQSQRYGSTFARALVEEAPSALEKYTKGKPFLYFTWTGKYDSYGFKTFLMQFVNSDRSCVDRLEAISGSPAAQKRSLLHPKDDRAGSGNPIPEGLYKIGPVIRMSAPERGVGYVKIPLEVLSDFDVNNRSEILAHIDFNKNVSPGTMGCIAPDISGMNRMIDWCEQKARPEILIVNYGVGLLKSKRVEVILK